MPRVRKGAARRQSRKRVLNAVKGHRGPASKLYRLAKEARMRADVNARIGRKLKKRDFRGLWIIRLSAACRQRGIRYSQFINGCKKAEIGLNRSGVRCYRGKGKGGAGIVHSSWCSGLYA